MNNINMPTQGDIKSLGPGYIHAPLDAMVDFNWEPILTDILADSPPFKQGKADEYTVDVKVHMLMPGQWPCIPNWHYDNVPRDDEGNLLLAARDKKHKMYLLTSGHPDTIFKEEWKGREWSVPAEVWTEFTQFDLHKGTMCKIHTWRLFIRLTPREILPIRGKVKEACERRHSQVYLDSSNFEW